MMRSRSVRGAAALMGAAVFSAGLVAFAPGAGASAPQSKKEFCRVVTDTDQSDLENLEPDSVEFALTQTKKLLKTHPPKKIKKALKTVKAAYEKIVDGESQARVLGRGSVLRALATVGTYISKNCSASGRT
jgi:hypothetical protein